MADITKMTIAVLATNGFEEAELTEPLRAARQAGASVDVIAPSSSRLQAPKEGRIQGFHHHDKTLSVPVDLYLDQQLALAENYHALILPGGALNADQMRAEPLVLKFVQEMQQSEKPIAAICHAPWILISAGLVAGRELTSYYTIKDDVINAGGHWVDREVVVNRNWVTSRKPSDLPAFNREMIGLFSQPIPLISEDMRAQIARARIA